MHCLRLQCLFRFRFLVRVGRMVNKTKKENQHINFFYEDLCHQDLIPNFNVICSIIVHSMPNIPVGLLWIVLNSDDLRQLIMFLIL